MIVQNADLNLNKKDLFISTNDLWVRNVFYTIQGEGPYAGHPSVFIRLAGCNRGKKTDSGCFFCDTDFYISRSKPLSVESLTDSVKECSDGRTNLVVVTGGEPLLHGEALDNLVLKLISLGYIVQIESNGDFLRTDSLPGAIIVVSPKVNVRTLTYGNKHGALQSRADYIKILISENFNDPYHTLPDFAFDCRKDKILLSPIAVYKEALSVDEVSSVWNSKCDQEQTSKNYAYAANLALEHGFKLSLQTHLFLAVQ